MDTDIALVIATVGLVVVTVAYVLYTRAMVREMRETRLLSTRPRLTLTVTMLGPMFGMATVANVGHGVAKDVDVTLIFTPPEERRPWTAFAMLPGDRADFDLPLFGKSIGSGLEIPHAAKAGATVRLVGSMRDVDGVTHAVDETISIADWWNVVSEAEQRFVEPSSEQVIRYLKKLADSLKKIEAHLGEPSARRRARARQRQREEQAAAGGGARGRREDGDEASP